MRTVLRISRFAAGAAVFAAVALAAWQCIDIFLGAGGEGQMYTAEDVSRRFGGLALPLLLCAAALVLAAVLELSFGSREVGFGALTPENRLRLALARVETLPEAAEQESRRRRRLTALFAVPMAAAGALCLFYLVSPASFPPWNEVGTNEAVRALILRLTPPALALTGLGIALSYVRGASIQRELALLRGAPKRSAAPAGKPRKNKNILWLGLFALAAVFVLLGVMNGGVRDVLYKAINICTECIGLG